MASRTTRAAIEMVPLVWFKAPRGAGARGLVERAHSTRRRRQRLPQQQQQQQRQRQRRSRRLRDSWRYPKWRRAGPPTAMSLAWRSRSSRVHPLRFTATDGRRKKWSRENVKTVAVKRLLSYGLVTERTPVGSAKSHEHEGDPFATGRLFGCANALT